MKVYNFPAIYAGWVQEMTGSIIPEETRATCSDCPMCKTPTQPSQQDELFLPTAKCCTYNPVLPNFLVGGILLDEDPSSSEGKALFEREALSLWISPMGIEPPWHYWLHYHNRPFGQSQLLRCPYYIDRDGGLCGIWKYRNSRCSTWFCKYDQGIFGLRFWQSLSNLLAAAEKGLSEWCISALNLEIPVCADTHSQRVWGNWAGKEREFFKNCYLLVSKLTWNEAVEHAGPEARKLEKWVSKRFREMNEDSIPGELVAAEFRAEQVGDGMVRIWGYGRYDPIDVTQSIYEKILEFDGDASVFEDGVLRDLYNQQILKAAGETPSVLNAGEDACGP